MRCDNWVCIKISGDDPHYRILAGWSGGYLQGDSWRLNSGVVKVNELPDSYEFVGASGSVYECGKHSYGLRMNNTHVYEKLKELHGDKVKLMEETTDWMEVDWIIKGDKL